MGKVVGIDLGTTNSVVAAIAKCLLTTSKEARITSRSNCETTSSY
jgi:molecular chaperone DnaK (HSP70)